MIACVNRSYRCVLVGLIGVLALLTVPAPAGAQQAGALRTALLGGDEVSGRSRLGFLERQLTFPRVEEAWSRKAGEVRSALESVGVRGAAEIYFRVFKREQELEVWARGDGMPAFTLVRSYPICALSGRLGPKRREGDGQVPEGFYTIETFNPWSAYHLSLRLNYPNAVDRFRSGHASLGGDIFIHGGCATVGCVPVTDEWVEELYVMAAGARDAGQRRIPVHVFPTRLDDEGLQWLAEHYGTDFVDYSFWENLRQGYLFFELTHLVPRISHVEGRYVFDAHPIPRSPVVPPAPELLGIPVVLGAAMVADSLE